MTYQDIIAQDVTFYDQNYHPIIQSVLLLFDSLCSIIKYLVISLFSVPIFDLFSVIFCPDTGILFQVLRSRYTEEVTCYRHQPSSKSINIIKYKTCTWFWLSIGVRRPIAIIVTSQDIRNQFLQLGSRRARQLVFHKKYIIREVFRTGCFVNLRESFKFTPTKRLRDLRAAIFRKLCLTFCKP